MAGRIRFPSDSEQDPRGKQAGGTWILRLVAERRRVIEECQQPGDAGPSAALLLVLALPLLVWPRVQPPASEGFFGVREQGVWSFVDPQGQRFFSVGINVINPADEEVPGPRYRGLARHGGNLDCWRTETLDRLKRWNVNTIGAWSSLRGMPSVVELSLSYSWIDVFGEPFELYVRKAAQDVLKRPDVAGSYPDLDRDPLLIGYFTDNELAWGWGYGWFGAKKQLSLFEYYASLKPDAPGKKAWLGYLKEVYQGDWQQLSLVWNVTVEQEEDLARLKQIAPRSPEHHPEASRVADGFLRLVAERYFSVTSRVMRGRLPHHLNLGTRLTHRASRTWWPRLPPDTWMCCRSTCTLGTGTSFARK